MPVNLSLSNYIHGECETFSALRAKTGNIPIVKWMC